MSKPCHNGYGRRCEFNLWNTEHWKRIRKVNFAFRQLHTGSCRGHRRLLSSSSVWVGEMTASLTKTAHALGLLLQGVTTTRQSKPKHGGLTQPPHRTTRTSCCTKGKYCSYISKALSERFSTFRHQHCGSPAGRNRHYVRLHDPSKAPCVSVRWGHTCRMVKSEMAAMTQDTNNSLKTLNLLSFTNSPAPFIGWRWVVN